MNYSDTLDYLYTQLPMFQRSGPAAYKNNLDNILKLDEYYGHPHQSFKTIHVAGTNGKGSVAHMLAAILQSAGYKTGLYTSPHLKDFRERIRVNGIMIPEDAVTRWVAAYKNNHLPIQPSFFELTVAMAFDYFARQKVDVAVVEVGLGGRLDSTNIVMPEVSIITNISFDHTNLLGNTLEKIAAEKAGIIKKNTPVVVGQSHPKTQHVFVEKAQLQQAPLYFADKEYKINYATLTLDGKQMVRVENNGVRVLKNLQLDLLGSYQQKNLATVLKTLDVLQKAGWAITENAIRQGLKSTTTLTGLQGRWQVLGNNPQIVCDTAHNEDGIDMVFHQLRNTPYKTLHVVFGTVADKDPENILRILPQNAVYYFTRASIPRAMNPTELAQKAMSFGLHGRSYKSVSEALTTAKQNAGKNDFIFVGGSTFVVAEIL